jgi:uncharacterized protein involved in outer membrane biogenesis
MQAAELKQNRWVRRGLAALLILLAVWLLAWLAAPPIAKGQIERIASEQLGRQVTIGKVDFTPWTLEAAVHDLRIATADGTQAQLAVKRVYLDAELQSLFRLAPVVDAVAIDEPVMLLTHLKDGKFDIDDILARFASAPDAPPSEPARFAIYNIAVTGGALTFDDQTVGRKHALSDLTLQVPFLSNLSSKREVTTEPKLAFVLNGGKFDSVASSTPFAENQKTDARIRFEGLDLAPYLGYIPAGLPVSLRSGLLDADLQIGFEQAETPALKITGTVAMNGVKTADAKGQDLLGFDSLQIALADVRPFDRVVHLSRVALAAPRLTLARDAGGTLNLLAGAEPRQGASAPAEPAQPSDWKVQVDKIALTGGAVGWRDQTTQPAAAVDVNDLAVEATAFAWPMSQPAAFGGSASIGGGALKFTGQATDQAAQVQAEAGPLPLSLAAPYLAQSLVPVLDGQINAQIDVDWTPADLKVTARSAVAENLALTQAKKALASIGRIELRDAEADITQRTLAVGGLTVANPKLAVERDKAKRWMFEPWLKQTGQGEAASKDEAPAKPWALSVAELALDGGAVSYADRALDTPVVFEISALKVEAQKIAPDTATASPLKVSGRIAAGRADAGRFEYDGRVALKPLAAEGRAQITSLPAHAFKGYYADALNIDIRRALASYRGSVKYADTPQGASVQLAGDTAVDDVRANSEALTQGRQEGAPTVQGERELLRWKSLGLRGVKLDLKPGAPLSLDVGETTLSDFFARIIIDPNGRLNLLDVVKRPADEAAPAEEVTTQHGSDGTNTATAVPAAPAAPAAADPMAPAIRFGAMALVNGQIDFTDLFVKPNYSADLTELTGRLSSFSSRPQENGTVALADLELQGKAQQTASLAITGQLNPLAQPLQLDITAKMRDLDLPPLSPYSIRFAGHGIDRGKLSMDAHYQVAPDGALTASNRVILNQLQFGDQVEGAPASLPVRLAVALLADRNGVIDLDLPLSGSINDPQFSIGPLVFKAIVNLIVKAVTSPFALLAGLGGGSAESNAIVFAPGSAELSDEARQSLGKLTQALNDRPTLQMTITGTASLDRERDAYRRARVRELAQAEKRRTAQRAGQKTADAAPLTDAEYPEFLAAAYKRADITKPRNLIGLVKELPVQEMENLLVASIPVDEETMRQLAQARGAAVRDDLLAQGVAGDRLFLGAVRTDGKGDNWKPGAELELATR